MTLDFLQELTALILSPGHFYHSNASLAVEATLLFSLPETSDIVQKVKDKLASEIHACRECTNIYHDACTLFFKTYSRHYNDVDLADFKKVLFGWNVSRQVDCLTLFCRRLASVIQGDQISDLVLYRQIRNESVYIIYEVLNYPQTLIQSNVDALFADLLEAVQKRSAMTFKSDVFPGVLLLSASSHAFVRTWALGVLLSASSDASLPSMATIIPIMDCIQSALEISLRNQKAESYSFSSLPLDLWQSISVILSLLKPDQLTQLFATSFTGSPDRWLVRLLGQYQTLNAAFELVSIFKRFMRASECKYLKELGSLFRASLLKQMNAESLFSFENGKMDDLKIQTSFGWISDYAGLAPSDQGIGFMFDLVSFCIERSGSWPRICQGYFEEQLLILLTMGSAKSPKLHDCILSHLLKSPTVPSMAIETAISTTSSAVTEFVAILKSGKGIESDFYPYLSTLSRLDIELKSEQAEKVRDTLCKISILGLSTRKSRQSTSATESLKGYQHCLMDLMNSRLITSSSTPLLLSLLCSNQESISKMAASLLPKVFPSDTDKESIIKSLAKIMTSIRDLIKPQCDLFNSVKNLSILLTNLKPMLMEEDRLPVIAGPATSFWLSIYLVSLSTIEHLSGLSSDYSMTDQQSRTVMNHLFIMMHAYVPFHKNLVPSFADPSSFYPDWFAEIIKHLLTFFENTKDVQMQRLILPEILFYIQESSVVATRFKFDLVSRIKRLTKSGLLDVDLLSLLKIWLAAQEAPPPPPVVRPEPPKPIAPIELKPPKISPKIPAARIIDQMRNQMRNESSIESRKAQIERQIERRNTAPLPSMIQPRLPSDMEDLGHGRMMIVNSADDVDDRREKRSIKMFDEPSMDNSRLTRIIQPSNKKLADLVDIKHLYKAILAWNIDSFGDFPPNLQKNSLVKIPDTFDKAETYIRIFKPLVILEMWQGFLQSVEETRFENFTLLVMQKCFAVDEFHELEFIVPGKDVRELGWADKTLLCLSTVSRTGEKVTLLALITTISMGNKINCKCLLSTRPSVVPLLYPKSEWKAVSVFGMTTVVREFEALKSLSSLSLFQSVLKPSIPPHYRDTSKSVDRIKQYLQVNEPQARAIDVAVEQQSGFVLIQGPPGTGKTKTILGIIGALQTRNVPIQTPGLSAARAQGTTKVVTKSGILCLAPSNAAIDEIARRLKSGIRNIKGEIIHPKLVRIGSVSVHQSVKDLTLDELVEEALSKHSSCVKMDDKIESTESSKETLFKELESLKAERARLDDTLLNNDLKPSETLTIRENLAGLNRQIYTVKQNADKEKEAKSTLMRDRDKLRREIRVGFLKSADVILSTLSGSGHDSLVELAGSIEFPTVIIDEACQAVELSCLIPLKYKVKKCILVGDPNQLPPTVISQLAQEYAYEQSLFQRLMKTVPQTVQLLSIQYRMHSDIVSFPSKYFYDGLLTNANEQLGQAQWHSRPLFQPYLVFDVAKGRESGSFKSFENEVEAVSCVKIVRELAQSFPSTDFVGRIGVITFYKGQVRRLKREFIREFGEDILDSIDINTVS